jgi:hypothetical protein
VRGESKYHYVDLALADEEDVANDASRKPTMSFGTLSQRNSLNPE